MTQAEIATPLGVSQGNVSFYEKGQTVPPLVASRLIDLARARGCELTFDEIYAGLDADRAGSPATEASDAS